MIISIDDLKRIYTDKDFSRFSEERLKIKLSAIESAIRKYCNNAFYDDGLNHEPYASVGGLLLDSEVLWLKVGDTIQISETRFNNGLYVVEEVADRHIKLDKTLHDDVNLVSKIKYPLDVIDGAIELLDWAVNKSDKADITSESISRHSVSYQNLDNTNTIDGFPIRLFGFCKKYCRARTWE